ncbi:MAG: hypothetical protein ACJ71L_06830 [Nitrososphaeraceae archaeon]
MQYLENLNKREIDKRTQIYNKSFNGVDPKMELFSKGESNNS